jgi:hypothetical protein
MASSQRRLAGTLIFRRFNYCSDLDLRVTRAQWDGALDCRPVSSTGGSG